jgi:hypothetical protein
MERECSVACFEPPEHTLAIISTTVPFRASLALAPSPFLFLPFNDTHNFHLMTLCRQPIDVWYNDCTCSLQLAPFSLPADISVTSEEGICTGSCPRAGLRARASRTVKPINILIFTYYLCDEYDGGTYDGDITPYLRFYSIYLFFLFFTPPVYGNPR